MVSTSVVLPDPLGPTRAILQVDCGPFIGLQREIFHNIIDFHGTLLVRRIVYSITKRLPESDSPSCASAEETVRLMI